MEELLATDASCVVHLRCILDGLARPPPAHLQKICAARVSALMHARDPAVRWAAMSIAHRLSCVSTQLLTGNAQPWVASVLPSLSKPEPTPVLRAAMRYLALVLCAAGHSPEFQRQVAVPVVPKVSAALIAIAEKHSDPDIQIASMQTLAQLVPLYPSLHKALGQRLFALCSATFSAVTTDRIQNAAMDLYAVLHFLGGKVGGPNLWRTCLDEALHLSWSAWLGLRTTFPTSAKLSQKPIASLRPPDHLLHTNPTGHPLTVSAQNLDNLRCGIGAIIALLRTRINRPVPVPIGHLATFCWCLLASTLDDESQTHLDSHIRAAESAAIPQIWMQGCRLLSCVAQATQELLAPHLSKLIMIIASHLERDLEPSQKHHLLQCAYHLLYHCPVVGAILGINRLLKATISFLSPLYLHQPRVAASSQVTSQSKSKKRRREYEAEHALSATNIVVCATNDEYNALLAALDVTHQCMLQAELVSSTRSLANRVLLSILLSLPSIPPSSLSLDLSFHGKALAKIRETCVESVHGISHALSKGTGIVLGSFSSESLETRDQLHSRVDLLLHPRRPPYVRTLPFVESLSLSSAEESVEETTTRRLLGLAFGNTDTRESQDQSEPANHPERPDPPQERVTPTPTTSAHFPAKATTPIVLPAILPLTTTPEDPAKSPEKAPAPVAYVAPMLVDESDHEEVPTIDVDSDSDSDA